MCPICGGLHPAGHRDKELEDKLETVKKLVEKGPSLNVDTLEDCQQAVDDWLGKLMNVLEAAK